jgi:hypothetical protein
VAHVGQEGALGAAGALGGVLGQGQLAGAGLHQALELEAVAGQLALGALLFGDVGGDAAQGVDAAVLAAQRELDRDVAVQRAARAVDGLLLELDALAPFEHPAVVAAPGRTVAGSQKASSRCPQICSRGAPNTLAMARLT